MITLCALEHECAHAFAARRFGYALDQITLMPYGAVISGDISGISRREEVWVCLAGPLVNGVTALLFAALWWLFPETYPYTDTAAYASLSLLLVNLLPAYPLDGGRLLRVALMRLPKKRARVISLFVSILTAAAIFGYFVWSCFSAPNFSALAFAVLLIVGNFGGGSYSRVTLSRKKSFARGVEEKRIALSKEATAGYAMRFLGEDRYVTFLLFDGEEFYGELPEEEFFKGVERSGYATPLKEYLRS